jgi:hypothetical protein
MEVTLLEEKRGAEYLAGAVLKMWALLSLFYIVLAVEKRNSSTCIRFEVVTVLIVKTAIFMDVTPCNLVQMYWCQFLWNISTLPPDYATSHYGRQPPSISVWNMVYIKHMPNYSVLPHMVFHIETSAMRSTHGIYVVWHCQTMNCRISKSPQTYHKTHACSVTSTDFCITATRPHVKNDFFLISWSRGKITTFLTNQKVNIQVCRIIVVTWPSTAGQIALLVLRSNNVSCSMTNGLAMKYPCIMYKGSFSAPKQICLMRQNKLVAHTPTQIIYYK